MRIGWAIALWAALAGNVVQAGVRNPYRFEQSGKYYKDLLQLRAGGMRLGKILEWSDQILVFGADGTPTALDAADVDWVQVRRDAADVDRPALPDLTIAYVERLPRATSRQGNVTLRDGAPVTTIDRSDVAERPKVGDSVTFRVHILNAGVKRSAEVKCEAAIDGRPLGAAATVPAIEPGGEYVAEFTWPWAGDADELAILLDRSDSQEEWLRWNNEFREPVNGLSAVVVVPTSVYDAFRTTPNLVDSFCFEDYAQYHIQCFNALLAASKYPTAPDGIRERLRLDRIVVTDDADESAIRKQLVNKRGAAEYDALVTLRAQPGGDAGEAPAAIRVDWPALKRLGLEIGLNDATVFETRLDECGVYDRFGRPAIVRYVPTTGNSIMRWPGAIRFSEVEAAYLNRVAGEPRGPRGSYRYQVPESVVIEVVGANGGPVAGASIDVFQLATDATGRRQISGPSGSDPWVAAQTDENGRAMLPNRPCAGGETPDGYSIRPNPFGQIDPDGGNGLLLLRLRHGDGKAQSEAFSFLSLDTCNLACLHGAVDEYVHRIATRFNDLVDASAVKLPYAFVHMPERDTPHPDLTVAWAVPSGVDLSKVEEYRLYRRIGFGGEDTNPWTLVATIPQPLNATAQNSCPQPYFDSPGNASTERPDTWFAVAVADRSNREGPLSEPTFLPYGKESQKLAIRDNTAFITLSGQGPPIMLYFDAVAGTQAYLPRTDRVPGYSPYYEGVAFGRKGLVVTDPVNNVLAVYDVSRGRHELIETIPARSNWPCPASFFEGEFNSPADVASDAEGNLYVADRGNHRVQILSPDGAFKSLLDPDFRFRGPHAIACSNQRLCVTDDDGKRVRVYDLRGGAPKFDLELPPLVDADRALVTELGQILVTGRQKADDAWAVLRFAPDGQGASFLESIDQALMGQLYSPRGLYQHEGEKHLAYCVNAFPFDVRIIRIGTPPGEK